jgi:UPF0271 protein
VRAVARIDLNCDMGESFGPWRLGADEEVMPLVTSANVACGFHAGDPRVMWRTVRLAVRYGVGVGAHPGLPDLVGFGRRRMAVSPDEANTDVLYQLGALAGMCRAAGVRLQHVKPHGEMYNAAAADAALADAICQAVRAFDPDLILVAPPGSELERAGVRAGLRVAREGFADRAYEPNGRLVPRDRPGAVITDPGEVAERVVRMAADGRVRAADGRDVALSVDTVCVHGDTPGAVELLRRIRAACAAAGVEVLPLGAAG